jgi:hydroxyethylthiazole kinase-like uncharacterized protein yjeF
MSPSVEPSIAFSNSHPIMSCEEAQAYESELLDSDEKVWSAMETAGRALARGILEEYQFTRYGAIGLKTLGLIGKGHNGGDTLLAIAEMARAGRSSSVVLALADARNALKANTQRALGILEGYLDSEKLQIVDCRELLEQSDESGIGEILAERTYDICIDGLLGMQFKPPMRSPAKEMVAAVNSSEGIRFRVAVDMPSGFGDESDTIVFRADTTFATGIFKKPIAEVAGSFSTGCIRYLDIGLFDRFRESPLRVTTGSLLDGLRARRPANVEKRTYGHLFIIAGSRRMPGALMMSVKSALRSGAGLVTVCVPESLAAHLAPMAPEAMWLPWPETRSGGLASRGLDLFDQIQTKASAILVGPGMGDDVDTVSLLIELLKRWSGSTVVDADALQTRVMYWIQGPCIITPHLGEFKRIAQLGGSIRDLDRQVKDYAKSNSVVVALKGPMTRISDGYHLYLNTTGNSTLARGGSGDLLAGMTAALLAQSPQDPLGVACKAVHWHGRAADVLAARKGQVAVETTDLLECYSDALIPPRFSHE